MATADNLYQSAVELASTSMEENFLEIGSTLRKLQKEDTQLFLKAVEKSGIGLRKAYYLVEINRAFEGRKLPKSRLKKLGWTKCMIIAKHVDKFNGPELMEMAEQHNTKQLEQLMKGEKVLKDAHCVLLYFSPKEYKLFGETVLQNGAKRSGRGFIDKEKALFRALKKTAHESLN